MTPPLADPTPAQIEQAWRGQPITVDAARDLPAPPHLSKAARRINLWLLVFAASLYAVAGLCLAFQTSAEIVFVGVGLANLLVCVYALRSHRVLGIAFRSRFIARREREPVLYWASLSLFAISGAFLLFVLFSVDR
jgi:hypothetical protein